MKTSDSTFSKCMYFVSNALARKMEKLAIEIQPVRVSKKTKGFNVATTFQPAKTEYEPAIDEEEDDEEFENTDAVAKLILTP